MRQPQRRSPSGVRKQGGEGYARRPHRIQRRKRDLSRRFLLPLIRGATVLISQTALAVFALPVFCQYFTERNCTLGHIQGTFSTSFQTNLLAALRFYTEITFKITFLFFISTTSVICYLQLQAVYKANPVKDLYSPDKFFCSANQKSTTTLGYN